MPNKRRKRTKRAPDTQVEATIKAIKQDHQTGSEILDRIGRRASAETIRAEAERLKLNADTVRKLRQFADRERGYTSEELEELCELCRKHSYQLGRSFVFKFLTVPKAQGQRVRFQKEVVRNKWSRAEVDNALCARFGRRRSGGKKPAIAESVDGVLAQVDSLCLQFRRLVGTLKERDETEETPSLQDLPVGIRVSLELTDVFLEQLQDALDKELGRSRES